MEAFSKVPAKVLAKALAKVLALALAETGWWRGGSNEALSMALTLLKTPRQR